MRAGRGAAVGVVTEGVDVHAALGIGVVAGDVPRDLGRGRLALLLEGDGTSDLGVTTDDSDWSKRVSVFCFWEGRDLDGTTTTTREGKGLVWIGYEPRTRSTRLSGEDKARHARCAHQGAATAPLLEKLAQSSAAWVAVTPPFRQRDPEIGSSGGNAGL